MALDPLSDVLALLKPRSYLVGGFDMGGDFSIGFDRHDGIKCYAVAHGGCWLAVDGVAAPVRLEAGDCLLLPRGWPFRLASDLALTPRHFSAYVALPMTEGIAVVNGGGGFSLVGSHFKLSGAQAPTLLGVLPPIVHIRREADRAAMRWCMERMRHELRDPQPGGFLVAEQLATMMLVQALRLHMAEGERGGVGWLFALADRQIGAAIAAMHAEPARGWVLQELAVCAGMSRSTFAQRFRETVGATPMEYLTRWRMMLAADRLENSGDQVAAIARSLGYESESAFSTAFKRVMGCSPRGYVGRGVGLAAA